MAIKDAVIKLDTYFTNKFQEFKDAITPAMILGDPFHQNDLLRKSSNALYFFMGLIPGLFLIGAYFPVILYNLMKMLLRGLKSLLITIFESATPLPEGAEIPIPLDPNHPHVDAATAANGLVSLGIIFFGILWLVALIIVAALWLVNLICILPTFLTGYLEKITRYQKALLGVSRTLAVFFVSIATAVAACSGEKAITFIGGWGMLVVGLTGYLYEYAKMGEIRRYRSLVNMVNIQRPVQYQTDLQSVQVWYIIQRSIFAILYWIIVNLVSGIIVVSLTYVDFDFVGIFALAMGIIGCVLSLIYGLIRLSQDRNNSQIYQLERGGKQFEEKLNTYGNQRLNKYFL